MMDKRRALSAVFLVLLLAWYGEASGDVSARTSYDWCSVSCGAEESCSTECENDGGGTTTCGEYDDGPVNDWCDGDTCDNVCGPWAATYDECYYEDELVDCYEYGVYAVCGDDACANISGEEDCTNCEQDCDVCPEIECDDNFCDDVNGETYRNCPEDCDEPPPPSYCGDNDCKTGEGPECPECRTPKEFCGWDYNCPMGFDCVGNSCVHTEFVGELPGCVWNVNDEIWDCVDSSRVCRQARGQAGQIVRVCVPWHWQ
jgi:hypothetical protein